MRAIVADRNGESRQAALAVLRGLQAEVQEVTEGEDFIDRVMDAAPDLVVADLDTVTLLQLKAVRERMPSLSLLLTYAAALSEDLSADFGSLLVVGSTDFLTKPFNPLMFLHRIRTLATLAPFLPGGAGTWTPTTRALLTLHDAATGRLDASRIAGFMGLPLKALAQGIGRPYRTVHKTPHAPSLQPELRPLRRSLELLLDMLGTREAVLAWLNTPSPDFSGQTPLDLIKAGDTESVRAFLEQVAAGAPT